MRKFWKNVNARFKIGLIITLIFLVIGFVVYYFPHVNPFTYNSYPKKLQPSWEHWLGTTSRGQDVAWLLVEAIHNSLSIGLIVATIGTVMGVLVGLIAGFSGGIVDRVLTVITDTFVVIPSLPILVSDDGADEGFVDGGSDGAGARDVRMGVAEPPDSLDGAFDEGARIYSDRLVLRRGHAAGGRNGNSAVCAYLVAFELHERHACGDCVRIQPRGARSFARET